MLFQKKLPWAEPLEMANAVSCGKNPWALLYSGNKTDFTGRFSFLALLPEKEIKGEDFSELEENLTSDLQNFENAWFGYLGYGLKNSLEKLPNDSESNIKAHALWFIRYRLIIVFDHETKTIKAWAKNKNDFKNIPKPESLDLLTAKNYYSLQSNMSKEEYLEKLSQIKESILRGDLYQANLTRKFFGEFKVEPSPFKLFCILSKLSPAPYSAFLNFSDMSVISSSPECFVSLDENGKAESRPIKGSYPRFAEAGEDKKAKEALAHSEKDKAENLMIVDLMRNDFSRSCKPGTVEAKNLFDITSYTTIHHMSSTINGLKKDNISTLQFVKNCFPPGSMTGAPKIKAIELCSQLEKQQRGIYSGAIGWFGGNGTADLSVVIRTLIIQGTVFEFQVGGAIVSDSDAIKEWQETLLKAKAIAETLCITKEELERI